VVNNANISEFTLDYMASAPIGVTQSVLAAFATGWESSNITPLSNVLSNASTIQSVTYSETAQGTCPSYNRTNGTIGAVGFPPLPGTTSAIISKYTALKGQHGRGRNYMPYVPSTFTTPGTDPNLLNGSGVAAYVSLMNAFLVPVTAGGTTWRLSVTTRPAPPNTLTIQAAVVTYTITTTILGTTRRRREGRGI
jgi:hypothetical protein